MRHAGALNSTAQPTAQPVVSAMPHTWRGRLLSLAARLRGAGLDRQLAVGVEPWRSPLHATRARQLTSHRNRRRLARSLERLIEEAESPRHGLTAVVPPAPARVREARPQMLTLSARLRGDRPVAARGIAVLKDLLSDGGGPFYTPGDPETLRRRLRAVDGYLDALD
jgi:hypothetical protein